MSYAIIRNSKYTINQTNIIYRHNERKNTNYSNTNINHKKSIYNYAIKKCNIPYSKRFQQIKEEKHLQGRIKRTSNIVCEYIITSDKEFFDEIGEKETKRYFQTAYQFVTEFKNLGEDYIISAKVHMDESTPHMHLVFVPVVHTKDKNGNPIEKVSCSEFWKGKNSYKMLQDYFYKYMTKAGFILERGETDKNKHISIEQLKAITNYEIQQFENKTLQTEQELNTNNIEELRTDYRRVIKKFNTLAKQYTKIKVTHDTTIDKIEKLEQDYAEIKQECAKAKKQNHWLKHCLYKTLEYTSILFDFPIERLKRLVRYYIFNDKGEKGK